MFWVCVRLRKNTNLKLGLGGYYREGKSSVKGMLKHFNTAFTSFRSRSKNTIAASPTNILLHTTIVLAQKDPDMCLVP